MIHCEHFIVQRVFSLFFRLTFNNLYPISVAKIVVIYQGLSKGRLRKEYVGRKIKTLQRLICAAMSPLHLLPPSPQEK